jgi:predicted metal-dependent hydrolase
VSSEIVFSGGGIVRPLMIRRIASARRMRLAVDPRTGNVRLTLPRRASERAGRVWAEKHRSWVEAQLAALPVPRPILPGGTVPFQGRDLLVDWDGARSRTVKLEGDRLIVGGPPEGVARRVITWLKRQALARLEMETAEIAAIAGVSVAKVSIGDPRARWGSCSSRGDIRYSWRLIMAPPFVLTSTVAHEVAHRLHMDHSPAFREAEQRLYGADPDTPRAWLRRNGASLYWVG